MNSKQQNDLVVNSFLERTFLGGWKNPELERYQNMNRVEIFFDSKCNLNCKYCYLARFKDLYPMEIQGNENLLKNMDLILKWFVKNKYHPDIEFFSGEPLIQDTAFKAIDMILDTYKYLPFKPNSITVPTNYTFLLKDDLTKRVENLLAKGKECGIGIYLSASFDGKYCEDNRPLRAFKREVDPRDDAYYDKCFEFSAKYNFGFHPMVYSEHIEDWPKNFLWFQENMKKHGIPPNAIYLLEVRNEEWTNKQINDLGDFMKFLIKWTFEELCHKDIGKLVQVILEGKGYNILGNPFSTIGRGLGCSIQSILDIRVGDLSLVPCHRTSYAPFVLGHLNVENNEITGIEADNPELLLTIYSLNANNFPFCESCMIKHLCCKGCLGSQFETTGDLFTPIPTVCKMEHKKILSIIEALDETKALGTLMNYIAPEKVRAIDLLWKIKSEKKCDQQLKS